MSGHTHKCGICGYTPFCCKHKWTIAYIAVVVTAELALILRGTF